MADEVKIMVKFTIQEEGMPSFTDAIYFGFDEYNDLSQDQIEELKLIRYNNWKTAISTPPQEEISEE